MCACGSVQTHKEERTHGNGDGLGGGGGVVRLGPGTELPLGARWLCASSTVSDAPFSFDPQRQCILYIAGSVLCAHKHTQTIYTYAGLVLLLLLLSYACCCCCWGSYSVHVCVGVCCRGTIKLYVCVCVWLRLAVCVRSVWTQFSGTHRRCLRKSVCTLRSWIKHWARSARRACLLAGELLAFACTQCCRSSLFKLAFSF